MSQQSLYKKLRLFFLLIACTTGTANAQYVISGPDCVMPGYAYGPYHVSSPGMINGETGQWCATGGTINGAGCFNVTYYGGASADVGVTWNSGITTGTLAYYKSGNAAAVATYTITIAGNTISNTTGIIYPYVPLNQSVTFTIPGSELNTCLQGFQYVWQKSTNNSTYTDVTGYNTKDFFSTDVFTIPVTFYRRMVTDGVKTSYSNVVQFITSAAIVPGTISPAYILVKAGANPATTFTATTSSGGSMCGGNYTYTWESSADNMNWSGLGVSGLSYTPGTNGVPVKTYIRQKIQCGPLINYTNTATIDVYKGLTGGTVSPATVSISPASAPGSLTCNAASGGNTAVAYSYQWEQSTNAGSTFQPIGGATSLNFSPGSLTANTVYRRRVTCDGQTAYSTTCSVRINTGAASTSENYVKTRLITKPGIINTSQADALADIRDVKQSFVFFDGLGRQFQTVLKQGSLATGGTATDMVSITQYDAMGREAFRYLPFVSTATDGEFKPNYLTEQNSFNNTEFAGEDFYYSQTDFEPSPLGRPFSSAAPGLSWAGSNRSIGSGYYTNNLVDAVRVWNITNMGLGSLGTYATLSIYRAGQLYKTITTDEQGNQVIEFKDKEGKIILKKVQLTAAKDDGNGQGHTGWLCTYYMYDNLGQLRCVLQPKGVELIAGTWALSDATLLAEQCFRYEYDDRNRIIIKKMPGAGEVHMVYDKRDRLAMTQDANQRSQGKWLVTLYDALNRPVRTYLWDNADSRSTHEAAASATIAAVDYPTLTGSYELLTETYYDNYDWVSASGSGLSASIDQSQITTGFLSPSNTAYPYPQDVTADYNVKSMVTGSKTKVLSSVNQYLYTVIFYDDRGRTVQMQGTNYIGGKDVSTTQYSFDGKALVTRQSHQLSPTSSPIATTNRMTYDAGGRLLKTTHTIQDASTTHPEVTLQQRTYDDLGQLKTRQLGLQQNPDFLSNYGHPGYTTTPLEVLDYTYNIRGWISGINRGYSNPDRYASEASSQTSRWFGMELNYDRGFSHSEYNGNISGTIWRSRGDGEKRAYDFSYDAANRLLKADFTQNAGLNTWDISAGIDFSMKMGNSTTPAYDANGNIMAMQHTGYKIGGSTVIDEMQYAYFANTNKLSAVTEQGNGTTTHHLGDFTDANTGSDDYGYDENGNLVTDKNKHLQVGLGTNTGLNVTAANSAITYNHLNLPKRVEVDGKGWIEYTYDAAGNKLKKYTKDETVSPNTYTTTYYIGGFVYEQKGNEPVKLQHFAQQEGRVRPVEKNIIQEIIACPMPYFDDNGNLIYPPCQRWLSFSSYQMYVYDYFVKDHLGNVRTVLTDEQQQNNYPAATLENDAKSVEAGFYTIDEANIADRQAYNVPEYENNNGFLNPNPTGNSYATSEKVYKLNGSNANARKGLDMVLKVMSGDRIDIHGKSYHNSSSGNSPNAQIPILALLTGLLTSSGGIAAGGTHTTATALSALPNTVNPLNALQLLQQSSAGGNPVASINWILFDEHFNVVDTSFSPVGNAGSVKDHYADAQLQNIPVDKNGYLYVYCSNESPVDVFFDNLQVMHTRGPLLEETHYYPFGLTMAGISSKAAGKLENKRKFNGVEKQSDEFSDGSGLDFNATEFRSYDYQTGRFCQIDALSELNQNWSPYAFAQNNPISFCDPYGLDTLSLNKNGSMPAKANAGDVILNSDGNGIAQTYNGESWQATQDLGNATVTAKKNTADPEVYNQATSATNAMGWAGLGWTSYEKAAHKGDWIYTNSAGATKSIFNTQYGANKNPGNLGNIKNFSKNAQKAIRGTRVVKVIRTAAGVVVVVSTLVDVGQTAYAYMNNDPNANAMAAKTGINLFFTGVGFIPGAGWMISGIYFIGDAAVPGGWPALIEAGNQNTIHNREIIPNWNPRPGGGLAN